MNNLLKKITALVEVRKMMALAIILIFGVMALTEKLEVNFIQTVIISVISFYFGKTSNVNEKGAE